MFTISSQGNNQMPRFIDQLEGDAEIAIGQQPYGMYNKPSLQR